MSESYRRQIRRALNALLGELNLELVRKHSWEDPRTFIPFKETIKAAQASGLSVADYIDLTHNLPGATGATISEMVARGVFGPEIERICEIGAGSGRYLEQTLRVSTPKYYEVYETAVDWAQWLASKYGVTVQPTDGNSLASTPSASIDLLHAHKVFSVMPFLTTMRYFYEIVRVLKIGGKLVFDILDEQCMDDARLEAWTATGISSGTYPSFLPEEFTTRFFCTRGFELEGEFFIPHVPGITHYFVFSRVR